MVTITLYHTFRFLSSPGRDFCGEFPRIAGLVSAFNFSGIFQIFILFYNYLTESIK